MDIVDNCPLFCKWHVSRYLSYKDISALLLQIHNYEIMTITEEKRPAE